MKGLSSREIAAVLQFSEFTATAHVRNLVAKLGASDYTEAAAPASPSNACLSTCP